MKNIKYQKFSKNELFTFLTLIFTINNAIFSAAYSWGDLNLNEASWSNYTSETGSSGAFLKLESNTYSKLNSSLYYTSTKTQIVDEYLITQQSFQLNIFNRNTMKRVFSYYDPDTIGKNTHQMGIFEVLDFDINSNMLFISERNNSQNPGKNNLRIFKKEDTGEYKSISSILLTNDLKLFTSCKIKDNYGYFFAKRTNLHNNMTMNVVDIQDPYHPSIIQSIEIDTLRSSTYIARDIKPGKMLIENNIGYIYDGYQQFIILDINNPHQIKQILPSFTCPYMVFDYMISDSLLYLACGKNGLFVYNFKNISSPEYVAKYDSGHNDFNSVQILDKDQLILGSMNGTISILDISNFTAPFCIKSFNTYPISTLTNNGTTLYVGTDGWGHYAYSLKDIQNPSLLTYSNDGTTDSTSMHKDYSFTIYPQKNGGFSLTQMFITKDLYNQSRSFNCFLESNPLIVYNDSNNDGILSLNVSRSQTDPDMINYVSYLDEIVGDTNIQNSLAIFSEPHTTEKNGRPAIYFNLSAKDHQITNQITHVNITVDLIYGFWLIYTPEKQYSLKIDVEIRNIRYGGFSTFPSKLKIYSGFRTSVGLQTSAMQGLYYSRIDNDSFAQTFGTENNIIAFSSMADEYTTIDQSNNSQVETCTKSAIPQYIDANYQKVLGDSTHIYRWILGANFDLDQDCQSIIYDPDLKLFNIMGLIPNVDGRIIIGIGAGGIIASLAFIYWKKTQKRRRLINQTLELL